MHTLCKIVERQNYIIAKTHKLKNVIYYQKTEIIRGIFENYGAKNCASGYSESFEE